jgi:hypothetical protein
VSAPASNLVAGLELQAMGVPVQVHLPGRDEPEEVAANDTGKLHRLLANHPEIPVSVLIADAPSEAVLRGKEIPRAAARRRKPSGGATNGASAPAAARNGEWPLDRVLNRLAEMDYTVKQKGHWWRTRCPHHGGRSLDSLGLTEHDEDGHVSLHCFSGCDTKDILGAMGLTWRDLYTAPGEDAFNCTDLGNAERLIARHGDDMRYVPGWGWLVWSGKTWRRDEAAARERAKQTVRAIYDSASSERDDTRRQKLAKHAANSENASRINAMLQLAESTPAIQARVEDFDVEPWLLNVENGTIHLRTGQLHPHHREDLITKMAPVVYDPETVCPSWHAFLDRVMGRDGAMGAFLARAVGYSLSGDTTEQKWFFLHGLGANRLLKNLCQPVEVD